MLSVNVVFLLNEEHIKYHAVTLSGIDEAILRGCDGKSLSGKSFAGSLFYKILFCFILRRRRT